MFSYGQQRLAFFLLLTIHSLLSVQVVADTGDNSGKKGDDGIGAKAENSEDDDDDEYIEPPSINYNQFAKNADKEADFKEATPVCGDLYELKVKTPVGNELSLDILRGKVTLIVNILSDYGVPDPNYHDLVYVHSTFSPTGLFNIIAFPCFEFGSGQPSSSEAIQEFLVNNYGANFPIMDTVQCLGNGASDIFKFLSYEARTAAPTDNFWKFLVGPDGHLVTVMSSNQLASGLTARIREEIDNIHKAQNHDEL